MDQKNKTLNPERIKKWFGEEWEIKYEGFCDNHPTQCLEILKSCGGNRRKGLRRYKKGRR